jgi:hypothetical protein
MQNMNIMKSTNNDLDTFKKGLVKFLLQIIICFLLIYSKRVNFSARKVISLYPNINFDEVGVPDLIAKEVTVPSFVNDWNVEKLKEAILNGSNVHRS